MAIIHDTTMSPGKLELLATWLPAQSWYLGGGHKPALAKAGGFRPAGPAGSPGLSAAWRLPDGTQVRGILATADYMTSPYSGGH
jgi:hypothetical protein